MSRCYKKMIIGICDKSCSGKSTLANQILALTNEKSIHFDIEKVGKNILLLLDVKNEIFSRKNIIKEKELKCVKL